MWLPLNGNVFFCPRCHMVSFVDKKDENTHCKYCGFSRKNDSKYRFIWAKIKKRHECVVDDFETHWMKIPEPPDNNDN